MDVMFDKILGRIRESGDGGGGGDKPNRITVNDAEFIPAETLATLAIGDIVVSERDELGRIVSHVEDIDGKLFVTLLGYMESDFIQVLRYEIIKGNVGLYVESIPTYTPVTNASSYHLNNIVPNRVYKFGTLTGNITFGLSTSSEISGRLYVYHWTFSTGATPPKITWPNQITKWQGGGVPYIKPNSYYDILVVFGFAICLCDQAEYVTLPNTQGEPGQCLMLGINGTTQWAYPGDPRMKRLTNTILEEGDVLFYDRYVNEYVVVKHADVEQVLTIGYDHSRYETNYDSFIGTMDNIAHFVAVDDAMPDQNIYDNDVAATACYYRIEIENTNNGSITFSVASGNGSIAATTVDWAANEPMSDIIKKFTEINQTSNYITFAALADSSGVGLEVGGYGANTLTVTDSQNCTVIDCSALAFYRSENPTAPAVGGILDPTVDWIYIGENTHHNWRGNNASVILTGKSLVSYNSTLIAMTGQNYSYRCGGYFAKFKLWATSSGDNSFYPDGVNGSTNSSSGRVMRQTIFDTSVTSEATGDAALMYEYYNHLLNDATGDYATLRAGYEAKYGLMVTLYDAYLMSHMADPAANSGIVNTMRNHGANQTSVKADAMNVTYDYVVIPAYPPEYNAARYGNASTIGFAAGKYYHPELGDIALFMQDNIMSIVNANVSMSGTGTLLSASVSRGSCADSGTYNTWYFFSTSGCVIYNTRYLHIFRSRPVLALPLSA